MGYFELLKNQGLFRHFRVASWSYIMTFNAFKTIILGLKRRALLSEHVT